MLWPTFHTLSIRHSANKCPSLTHHLLPKRLGKNSSRVTMEHGPQQSIHMRQKMGTCTDPLRIPFRFTPPLNGHLTTNSNLLECTMQSIVNLLLTSQINISYFSYLHEGIAFTLYCAHFTSTFNELYTILRKTILVGLV